MALSPGTQLGPYEVLAPIGVGGMGEVYRAADTNLKRQVAIKVLPASVAGDTERLARFQREAEVLAQLNHPGIAQIYGVEKQGGQIALVMELVEGPTLADRIAQGPIPVDEALPIAKQIAEALEAAHEQGIIHRDLKPANIKVRPDGAVKVLDFGLAKALGAGAVVGSQDQAYAQASQLPTITTPAMTQTGMILGTAAYMSPEQAKGRPIDKRADIWAFGVIVWEFLTGERLFKGDTVGDTLAAVMRDTPDLTRVPAAVRPMLLRCLEKDERRRLRDIGDALSLVGLASDETPRSSHRTIWPWAVAGGFAAALVALGLVHFRELLPDAQPYLLTLAYPSHLADAGSPSISPNGALVAFIGREANGRTQLWLHALDSGEAHALPGTEGAFGQAFWSPDSRTIGFGVDQQLKRVQASGGPPTLVVPVTGLFRGGAWKPDGTLLYGVEGEGLYLLAPSSGTPTLVRPLDRARDQVFHGYPSFLPDWRHFVYETYSTRPEHAGTYLATLEADGRVVGEKQLVADLSTPAIGVVRETGSVHLLFGRGGQLAVAPLNAERGELVGEPRLLAASVPDEGSPQTGITTSSNGLVVTPSANGRSRGTLTWFSRSGNPEGTVGDEGHRHVDLTLSNDARKAAYHQDEGRPPDLFTIDLARATVTRLTTDAAPDMVPVWSPDDTRIAFLSRRTGRDDLYVRASDGSGSDEPLFASVEAKAPSSWSPDGRTLLFTSRNAKTSQDVWALSMTGTATPTPVLQTAFVEAGAKFSPDGRWIAYVSSEGGLPAVFVRPFPVTPSSPRWQVSATGVAGDPHWRKDGREIVYRAVDGRFMAVDTTLTPSFTAGQPRLLFTPTGLEIISWDATPDHQRFLMSVREVSRSSARVIVNWQALLAK